MTTLSRHSGMSAAFLGRASTAIAERVGVGGSHITYRSYLLCRRSTVALRSWSKSPRTSSRLMQIPQSSLRELWH
jgi:hypothetical protein